MWEEPEELLWLPPRAQELVRFACTRMVHSYKPVLMGIFLEYLPQLEFPFSEVAERFTAFYRARWEQGLPVERRSCVKPQSCGDEGADPVFKRRN